MVVYSNSVMEGAGLPVGTPVTPSKKWYWFNNTTNEITHEWNGSWGEIQVDFSTIAKLRVRTALLKGQYLITDLTKQGWFYRDLADSTTADDNVSVIVTANGIRYKRMTVPITAIPNLQATLDSKVTSVTGKVLSSNDYTNAEKTKLTGISTGATANDTDANLKNRANHTGTQSTATIDNLVEFIQDTVAAFVGAGTNVTVSYDDVAGIFQINSAGTGGSSFDAENARDALGTALVGLGNISITVNDAADTITITTTATVNSTDAALRDRTTHTGEQPISSITNLQSSLNAKANVSHAHAISEVAGLQTALDSKLTSTDLTETVQDIVGSQIEAGPNVTVAYNDTTGKTQVSVVSTSNQVHTTGSAITVTSQVTNHIRLTVNPSSILATLAITLPATPVANQIVWIEFGGTITVDDVVTALTVVPNSGQAIIQSSTPTGTVAGDLISYWWNSGVSKWYRTN